MRSSRFQLVDLAAVVSVAVLGLTLLVPAFARARTAARAASCSDNFKSIGLALHNYHSVFNQFPPGRIWADEKTLAKDPKNSAVDWGVGVMFLPFLEEAGLYNAVNFSLSWHTAANTTSSRTKVLAYLCPEDVKTTSTSSLSPPGQPTNIAYSLGSTAWSTHPISNRGPKPEGILFDNSTVGARDIIDGTANTVMASEQLIDRVRRGGPGESGDCAGIAVELKAFSDQSGTRWITGHPSSNYFNGRRTPNHPEPDCFDGISPTGIGSLNKVPRSNHAGGVHVLRADGAVAFVRNEIDPKVWQALLTRAGQERIDMSVFGPVPRRAVGTPGTAAGANSPVLLSLEFRLLETTAVGGFVSSVANDGKVEISIMDQTRGRPISEGLYLGIVIPPDNRSSTDPSGMKVVRATVTEIRENSIAIQLGPAATREFKSGLLVALIRPPGSTTAQLREVPDLVGTGGGEPALPPSFEPARNHLKQIGLALHNFHDTHGCFPPAVVTGPDGKPWHSWRVLILPFLGQAALYKEYDFSAPWDSPQNRKVLVQMPAVYHDPVHGEQGGQFTHFAAVTGQGTAFPNEGVAMNGKLLPDWRGPGLRRIREFRDGTAYTIMVGSVGPQRKIPWTKPEDVAFGPNFQRLGHADGFAAPHAGHGLFQFADGSVIGINESIATRVLSSLMTIDGREIVNAADIPAIPRETHNPQSKGRPSSLLLFRTPEGVKLKFEE